MDRDDVYDDAAADLTWQAGWSPSSVSTFQLIEDLVYTNVFDGRYRDARRSCLEVADFFNYPMVADRVTEIKEAIASEKAPPSAPPPSQAAAGTPGGNTGATQPAQQTGSAEDSVEVLPGNHPGFAALSEPDQNFYLKAMKKTIHSTIKLIVDDGSQSDLKTAIRDSPLAMTKGDPMGFVLFHFDSKKYGESTTRPDLRAPPLRDCYTRLVKTVLESMDHILCMHITY